MPNISSRQFGLIVAFLIPGFVGLAGLAPVIPLAGQWLRPANSGGLGIGPTIYALMAATAIGMVLSCLRWLLVDHVLEWMGIQGSNLDFRHIGNHLEALDYLSDNHYRFYQFYANTLMAILCTYPPDRLLQTSPLLGSGTDLAVLFLCLVLFLGSRDALEKYRARAGQLMGQFSEKGIDVVTNGIDHHSGQSTTKNDRRAKPKGKLRPENKPPRIVAKEPHERK
jgi:hypothetical protein